MIHITLSSPPPSLTMLLCSREDDPRYFNPLAPESDWFLISPYGSHLESNVKVMRIKEMITNIRSS